MRYLLAIFLFCVTLCGCVSPYYDAIKDSNRARVAVGADRAGVLLGLIEQQTKSLEMKHALVDSMIKGGILAIKPVVEFSQPITEAPSSHYDDMKFNLYETGTFQQSEPKITVYQQDNRMQLFFAMLTDLKVETAHLGRMMEAAIIDIPQVQAHPVYATAGKMIESLAPIGSILAGGWAAKELVQATGAIAGGNTTNHGSNNHTKNVTTDVKIDDSSGQNNSISKSYSRPTTISESMNPDNSIYAPSTYTETNSSPVIQPVVTVPPVINQPVVEIPPVINQPVVVPPVVVQGGQQDG